MHIHNWKSLLGILRVLSVMFLGVVFLVADGLNDQVLAQSGNETAPEFDVYSIDGRSFSKESLSGKPVLLMFWAPWCGVCQRELPKLAKFSQKTRSTDMQILTIGTAAPSDHVEGYVEEHSDIFVFPTVYDDDGLLQEDFKIKAYPTYLLLDGDGTILMNHRGGGILKNQRFHSLVSSSAARFIWKLVPPEYKK